MKLQKLAGYGPTASIVSGVSLIVFFVLLFFAPPVFGNNRALEAVAAILLLLALTLWPAALLVVGVDLEWLEHPLTHTGRMQASLVAGFIAIFLPVIFVITLVFFSQGQAPSAPIGLLCLCIGVFLLIQNWEARKAGLLHGVLPWIGLVSGGAFVLTGLSFLPTVANVLFMYVFAILFWVIATISFMFWSIWLGIYLRSAEQLPTTPAQAATPA